MISPLCYQHKPPWISQSCREKYNSWLTNMLPQHIFRPKCITTYSNIPIKLGHRKAVLCVSFSAMNIWLYLECPSIKDNIRCLASPLTNRSAIGIGYSSLGVVVLRFLKLIQILNLLFFLTTSTIFESHWTYLVGRINLAFSSL